MKKKFGYLFVVLLAFYWFCLPKPLFDSPYSTVIEDRTGRLLGARIANDGQWRFPEGNSVPAFFAEAVIAFEDKRFYSHWGVDGKALLRAIRQNIKAGKVVSGGSTISMQVIRLARQNKSRNIFQKIIEAILATRLEWRYSKAEILALYAAHAPFGGNVVGLEAASWRYYGKAPEQLSWGEAATMAVLPNSPALIHPGRNRTALLDKRNRLIDRLVAQGKLSAEKASLAKEEPLPEQPLALPQLAPHLLERVIKEQGKQKDLLPRMKTTIDRSLQQRCTAIARQHHQQLAGNGIHNLAILVLDIETGEVRSYIGNAPDAGAEHDESVDIVAALRSTGSILKPFLYAQLLHHGHLLPNSLLADIPTRINGYRPENFQDSYQGVIPADQALMRSLNIPFVRVLQDYGLEKFHFGLQKLGLHSINKPASHYGLTLILGGAESSLWEMTNAYACMARSLRHYPRNDGRYDPLDYRPAHFDLTTVVQQTPKGKLSPAPDVLSAAAIWQTFEAMKEVNRPNSEGEWENFQSGKKIAWKTGTSFGFRDAWAIGLDGQYAIGIWVGNADGEGRPGLIGVKTAGPILFDVMGQLEQTEWFAKPFDEMTDLAVCRQSGYRASALCEVDTMLIPASGLKASVCPYHQLLHLDASERFQVNDQCEAVANMVHRPWFVLPALEEHYYLAVMPNYKQAPPWRSDCGGSGNTIVRKAMQFIYPKSFTEIYIPIDLDGNQSKVVFKVTHRSREALIYWHLDDQYIGTTKNFHELALAPTIGKHVLTLVDANGERLVQPFDVLR
jgi:penicillin-binding protein 1C